MVRCGCSLGVVPIVSLDRHVFVKLLNQLTSKRLSVVSLKHSFCFTYFFWNGVVYRPYSVVTMYFYYANLFIYIFFIAYYWKPFASLTASKGIANLVVSQVIQFFVFYGRIYLHFPELVRTHS